VNEKMETSVRLEQQGLRAPVAASCMRNMLEVDKSITAVVSGSLAYGAFALARVRVLYLMNVLVLIFHIYD
jgi:hypothetical protein